ncbi:MAG: hypothetical protein KC620_09025, partial [Myxococcales bacterium]|nr:hypothetical protein [Myxococcales bacterium]
MSRRLLPFIAIAALGCADAPPLALPLAVEFSGCAAVGAGPTCAVSADAELVLWAPDAGLWTLRLMVDGEAREMGLDPTPGGLRHRLKVAPGQQLTIEADGPLVRARWSMSIVAAGEALTSMAEDSAARATRLLREGARARDLGHLQDALAAAEEVAQISARLDGEGLGDLPLQGQVLRAQVDARLGRYEDALGALIRTLAEPRLSDCLRAEANRTLGRTRTLARAADPRSPAGEPLEPLRAARSAFGERGECPDEGAFVGTLLEEAHAAAQSGKVAEARRA